MRNLLITRWIAIFDQHCPHYDSGRLADQVEFYALEAEAGNWDLEEHLQERLEHFRLYYRKWMLSRLKLN